MLKSLDRASGRINNGFQLFTAFTKSFPALIFDKVLNMI